MKKTFNSIISNFNYRYALILPILYSLITTILQGNAEYSVIKRGVLYLVYEENFFRILFGFLLILNFILFAFYKNKITRGNESFKIFNLNTNTIARKLTINFTIITTVIFLLSVVSLMLANCSRYEADSESLKKYNLISEDVTLFTYDEVTEIEVYLAMEGRSKSSSGYATNIELKTHNGTYTLSSSGFDDDYSLIKQFLSCFNEDIIIVDNTYSDETDEWHFYGYYEHPEIFEEIYKN